MGACLQRRQCLSGHLESVLKWGSVSMVTRSFFPHSQKMILTLKMRALYLKRIKGIIGNAGGSSVLFSASRRIHTGVGKIVPMGSFLSSVWPCCVTLDSYLISYPSFLYKMKVEDL